MAGPEVTSGMHGTQGTWGVFDFNNQHDGGNARPMSMEEKLQKNSIHVQAAAAQSAGAYMG